MVGEGTHHSSSRLWRVAQSPRPCAAVVPWVHLVSSEYDPAARAVPSSDRKERAGNAWGSRRRVTVCVRHAS